MIGVEEATARALRERTIRLTQPKVLWYLSRGSASVDPLDVTARVDLVPNTPRTLGPFLSGFDISDTTIVLQNADRRLSPGTPGSLIPGAAETYIGTKIQVQQGVIRADDSVEWIDVYSGRVQYSRFTAGKLELKLAGTLSSLRGVEMPEEYSFGVLSSSGIPYENPADLVEDLLTMGGADASADFPTSLKNDVARWGNYFRRSGWWIGGTVPQGASVGEALVNLSRSMLATIYEREDGTIGWLSEVLPAKQIFAGNPVSVPEDLEHYFPDTISNDNAFGFDVLEGLRTTATEVIVRYAGTSVGYRVADDETYLGRLSRTVSMPFCPLACQAAWAARVVYESFKQVPRTYNFAVPGIGLLIQPNDRVYVLDPETEQRKLVRIVGKTWTAQAPLFSAIEAKAEDITHDRRGSYDVTSWADSAGPFL